ncbi:YggT family protein [Bacillus oleivorans]|uniref:YggT family protein n=1 Tax=Bacillus oleivorans TaxID=1448271 RepID=A0A285D2R9_9BACI|nr:YggT family protein [Bacillus oleivorans]SNX73483.1 YggT family protein [Bacillus oleivorans]
MDTLLGILAYAINIYSIALIIYVLLSWFPGARDSAIGEFLGKICEPYLEPFRKIIPPIAMIDISPIVAFITLNLAQRGIYYLTQFV